LVVVLVISLNRPTAAVPLEITVAQAHEKYQKGVFLLDVRTNDEWVNDGHIPDTTLIPLDELSNRLGELSKDQEIVVVCRSGNRSQQGRDILRQAGFTNVTSMKGGIKEWKAAGYSTVTGQ
jgi:rhodanese-related sulfurtransferase